MTTAIAASNGQRQRPKELLGAMRGGTLYRKAAEQGMNLSAYLEREDPSHEWKDGTDAFTRLIRCTGIVTRSNPLMGYYADRFEAFDKTEEARALVPEWIARQWRMVSLGGTRPDPQSRALFLSDDTAVNTALRPYFTEPGARPDSQLAPAIPLDELVATTEPITGNLYRAVYLTRDATALRQKRVVEATEIPKAKLLTSQRPIDLYKYGVVLEASYEAMRRLPIDQVRLFIQLLAVQAEVDKVATVMDVLVNGDGNSGTAATNYNLTTLDTGAVAGILSLKGWLSFKMKFANPYMLTTALAQEATALQMLLLNVGSANWPLVAAYPADFGGGFQPINPGLRDGVALGWDNNAPSLTIVAFDRRFAIRRVTEIGSQISEVERWTTRQVETLTLTETEGYSTLDAGANKTLSVNA